MGYSSTSFSNGQPQRERAGELRRGGATLRCVRATQEQLLSVGGVAGKGAGTRAVGRSQLFCSPVVMKLVRY